MTHSTRAFVLRLLLAGIAGGCAAGDAGAQPTASPQARALQQFGDRVQAYHALRERVAAQVAPRPSDASPHQIRQHQEQVAAAIQRERQHSRPGDIFTPPVVPQFRTIIRRDLRSRDVRDALAALQDVPTLFLRVNGEWPPDVPRSTIPPRLLSNLYPLPDGLEYRFVGRHLALLDSETELIVDFIRDVVPSVVARR